jgi:hypothetical protein
VQNLQDYIKVYDDILDKETCANIITKFENESTYESVKSEIYKFDQLNITQKENWKDDSEMFSGLAYSAAVAYFNEIEVPVIPQLQGFEEIRIKRYRPSEDERFDLHVDVGDYRTAKRFLVIFTYLNDCEEGGETEFPTLGVSVKPKAGRVLVFPPTWMFPHAGKAPISGNKYIIGTYLHYV